MESLYVRTCTYSICGRAHMHMHLAEADPGGGGGGGGGAKGAIAPPPPPPPPLSFRTRTFFILYHAPSGFRSASIFVLVKTSQRVTYEKKSQLHCVKRVVIQYCTDNACIHVLCTRYTRVIRMCITLRMDTLYTVAYNNYSITLCITSV